MQPSTENSKSHTLLQRCGFQPACRDSQRPSSQHEHLPPPSPLLQEQQGWLGSHSRINSPLFRVSRLDRAPPKLCQLVGQLSSVLSVAPHAANIS
ncbi:hypothetical protein BO85DRAFT_519189 [Aspergillus piperis CBS 112811]|uniref:Uncharacterized protein n=1 Tax=Aspergillus piperis CBS 112811 TaxID=1448313 RepID=A0A8G1R2X7_9EURO|nr:hypothetical protein BO85DRAFT_519189 [Aspergillus piperis CBS 112811]RAH58278.1 hypothetical protein BO85DRAFT_519189 [Aspergillus piperis CBS 112811]